jgi:hypothetical protein
MQIALASVGDGEWMLQVAPVRRPGLFDRMFHRPAPGLSRECLQLSRTIHATLEASGRHSRFLWRADGPPGETDSFSEPT